MKKISRASAVLLAIVLILLCAVLFLFCGQLQKNPPSARLRIVGPAGLRITSGGQVFTKPPFQLQVKPGIYLFKYSAPGFRERWEKVELRDGQYRRIELELEPVTASVLINTRPTGAELVVDGRVVGATPLLLEEVRIGKYSGLLRMPGYSQRTIEWSVEDERPKQILIDLDENVGMVSFNSRPQGAQLSIGGRVVGVTPFKGELNEGKYLIRLERSGYVPLEQTVTLSRGQRLVREFVLSARPGGVKVVSEPAGAEIFVNETKRGVAPCTLGDLSPAVYTIRAVKAGYEPIEKTVEIVSGFQDEVRFSLVRSTGVLELTVRPAGVTVLVDGKLVGRTKSDGVSVTGTAPIVVREMAPGNHEVTVSHPRSRPESRTITVHVEKGKVCRPKAIDVWIANCEIRYKTGAVELGALYEENEKSILFGPEPGVKIAIDRGKLQYVRKLGSEDGE